MCSSDQQIQNLLDFVWPELSEKDAIEEKAFYAQHRFAKKQALAMTPASYKGSKTRASDSYVARVKIHTMRCIRTYVSNFCASGKLRGLRNDDRLAFQEQQIINISLHVVPLTAGVPALPRPYLSVSGAFRIYALRKYICRQFSMDEKDTVSRMEIRCLNATVGQDLSMYFIQRTMWYRHHPNVPTIMLKYAC